MLARVLLSLSCTTCFQLWAGGSGLNTVVIVNQNSAQSCELGNCSCERRQVPPDNVLRIHWTRGNTSSSSADFQTNLVTPLLAILAGQQLTNQIDYRMTFEHAAAQAKLKAREQPARPSILQGGESCEH